MLTSLGGYNDEMKVIVTKISSICLSSEFQNLCRELESVYRQCRMENPDILAFQDALYALLTHEDGERVIETIRH
jgi:hypothetical protein